MMATKKKTFRKKSFVVIRPIDVQKVAGSQELISKNTERLLNTVAMHGTGRGKLYRGA